MKKTIEASNFSLIAQILFFYRNDESKKPADFVIEFLQACGSRFFTGTNDTYANKFFKERKLSSGVRDSFVNSKTKEFEFNSKGGVKYLLDNLSWGNHDIGSTFSKFGITDVEIEKDHHLLIVAIVQLIGWYIDLDESYVSEPLRALYRRLLIENKHSLTREEQKEFFLNLPKEEIQLITEYLEKTKNRLIKLRTIIDPSSDVNFYDIYVTNNISYTKTTADEDGSVTKELKTIESADFSTIFYSFGTNIVLEATGGFGKTMFMKHLAMDAIYNFDSNHIIPILINARDYSGDEIETFIIDSCIKFTTPQIDKETIRLLIHRGMVIVLFDGLDEMNPTYILSFIEQLKSYSNLNDQSKFVISTRPTDTKQLEGFFTLSLLPFTKQQASKMINKVRFDDEIKIKFLKMLKNTLFSTHKDFCENPLLLTIMLVTYDKVGIPTKRYQFYKKVYEAMSEKYNQSSGRSTSQLSSDITPERMLNYLAIFSFRTHYDHKNAFTEEEIAYYLKEIRNGNSGYSEIFTVDDFIEDCVKKLCVLYKDGLKYRFIHRSFQEYFVAYFFSNQTDNKLIPISKYLDKGVWKTVSRVFTVEHVSISFNNFSSNILSMLIDMCRDRIEHHVYIPFLHKWLDYAGSDDEQFVHFIAETFEKIRYSDGPSNGETTNFSTSEIFDKIAIDYDFTSVDERQFEESKFVKLDEFRNGYFVIITEKDEYNSAHLEHIDLDDLTEDDDLVGTLYAVDMKEILKDTNKYQTFIDNLKETYLYQNFLESKNLLAKLENIYRKYTEDDLLKILN